MVISSTDPEFLLECKQPLHKMQVGVAHDTVFTHSTLAFFGLFGEDVTFESFLVSDLTATGNFEALLGAAVGFNLWHYITFFSYSLLAPQNDGNFLSRVGNVWKKSFSFSGGKDKGKQGDFEESGEVFPVIRPFLRIHQPFYWNFLPFH